MIKRFCDLCEQEITEDTNANIQVACEAKYSFNGWQVQITGLEDLCIYCLIRELDKRDFRPKVRCSCEDVEVDF